ncbi:MAG: D-inositol-3-phosphate glycosyltransferase [Gemmatimonadaceae bacterium]|nr:D-inositol-3-phosphate glycosyltransferase [Gemmatimonadaceae bacterium]
MRILWLKTELLHPVDKGGRIRTYQTLRALKERHHVTYLALDDGTAAADARELATEYCHELVTVPFSQPAKRSVAFYVDLAIGLFSPLPYAIAKYRSSAMRQAIADAVRTRNIELVICDFLSPSANVPEGLGVPLVLFQHNVEAAIWERHTKVAGNPVLRAYMALQWRRMRRFERRECHRYDHVIAVSDADAETMRARYGAPRVSAVPTGVDVDFFRPTGDARRQDANSIVFTGSMDWMPNEDGVEWFADEIFPLIRSRHPAATFAIVGRHPTPRVKALERHAGITVTGSVPDVRPYLERAAAVVVPLRIGGGTRLKIYEAMAMERAVVSTTIGAEGLPLDDGIDLVRADDAADFAAAVANLLEDREAAARIGAAAARRVRKDFSWARAGEAFSETCEAVAHRRYLP